MTGGHRFFPEPAGVPYRRRLRIISTTLVSMPDLPGWFDEREQRHDALKRFARCRAKLLMGRLAPRIQNKPTARKMSRFISRMRFHSSIPGLLLPDGEIRLNRRELPHLFWTSIISLRSIPQYLVCSGDALSQKGSAPQLERTCGLRAESCLAQ